MNPESVFIQYMLESWKTTHCGYHVWLTKPTECAMNIFDWHCFMCCHLRTQCLWDIVQPTPSRVIHSLHISRNETKNITFKVILMPNAIQELSWIAKSITVNMLMWRVCYVPQCHTVIVRTACEVLCKLTWGPACTDDKITSIYIYIYSVERYSLFSW